ncbi:hypothetical protein Sjap_005442 [Stephania japonica]|uniref:Uncharacterized protein n=1 Tax=Stephania japonica TaxID=461633 RepID=A0AAP0PK30_9MAGN
MCADCFFHGYLVDEQHSLNFFYTYISHCRAQKATTSATWLSISLLGQWIASLVC